MKKTILIILMAIATISLYSCGEKEQKDDFNYLSEQFADLKIIRYQVPGFDELNPNQKELLYYLYQAALSGRDIIYDQNYKHNLYVRRTVEAIVNSYNGDRNSEDFKNFMVYAKRMWFSNGIHHHYSAKKFEPEFSYEYFVQLVKNSSSADLPLQEGESVDDLLVNMKQIIFDPEFDSKRINLDPKDDLLKTSAMNYYDGVTQAEAEKFYSEMADKDDPTPISYGLNSQLAKVDGKLVERKWHVGGMYSAAIEKIVYWLEKASTVAESEQQKKALDLLIEYYKTGDLSKFDEYNIAWVNNTKTLTDAVNGYIETYGDPLGYKAAYESVVSFKDLEATKRISSISDNAQWFEDNSPIADEHKKEKVVGITAKVITVVVESGDASPSTPIGINLPNANWIRKEHGSKSVSLGNIIHAYDESSTGSGFLDEFVLSEEQIAREKEYGTLASDLKTDMHEVIGHASGQLEPGVGTPKETLKNYSSSMEETRADLVALYYLMDPKLIEIGVMPNTDVAKAGYDSYIRNGLMTQLARVELGENIEQAHMRNRQTISKWAYDLGKEDNVIEMKKVDGKTYVVINDYEKLQDIFGEMLKEVQRIKSQGDYEAAMNLVETYGVQVDRELHEEVLERYGKLNIAPYGGFINPMLEPVMEDDKIVDVKVSYPEDFVEQMLYYGKNYSHLPTYN